MKSAVSMGVLEKLSAARLFHEIKKILSEPKVRVSSKENLMR